MTDIVAMLRSPAIFYEYAADKGELLREAADTIEALRAENARLREELRFYKYERLEMTDGILAEIMWNAYCYQAGGKTFDGKPLPSWEGLGEERQDCWLAAARAARAAMGESDE